MARSPSARSGRVATVIALIALGWLGLAAAPVAAQSPTPREACAALQGAPGYQQCLRAARDALQVGSQGGGSGGSPATVPADDQPSGAELAEESLDDQQRVLWVIVAVVLVGMVVLVAWSWRRGMRRTREAFSPETLALMDRLIPPEVKAENPDATVGDGLTEKERKLFRGQRNLIIFLLVLPAAVFVLLQVWQPSVDTSVTIGEVARWAPLVLALPALWWVRRRVARALDAGDDRWSVLGLEAESGPQVLLAPRWGGGGIRATAVGPTVLGGTRYGRDVRITLGEGRLVTAVCQPGTPDQPPSPVPGFGNGTVRADDGWVIIERSASATDLTGPDGLHTAMLDLERAEQTADAWAPPAPEAPEPLTPA